MQDSGTFLCLDEKDSDGKQIDMTLWGMTESDPHRRIDFMYTPCEPTQRKNAKKKDGKIITKGDDRTRCLMDDYDEPTNIDPFSKVKLSKEDTDKNNELIRLKDAAYDKKLNEIFNYIGNPKLEVMINQQSL